MSVSSGDFRANPAADRPCEPWYEPDEVVRGILSTLPPVAGDRVVVVACVSEPPSRRLAEETGAIVLNVDVHLPGPSLPLPGETFDQVWCVGATTHVEDLARFADEVSRALRPGGRMLVADMFWDGFRHPRFADRVRRAWHAVPTKSVVSLFERSGLTDVEVLPWPGSAQPFASDGAGDALAEDLAEGRLTAALVLARKP